MSILAERPAPPNQATAFLVDTAAALFKDPQFSQEIEMMDQDDATEDEMGGRIAILSMLRASQTLPRSGAFLVVDALTRAGPESHFRSLEGIFGSEALPVIFSQRELAAKMPAQVESSLRLWRFPDGSYIFHARSEDPAFGEFCRACLEDEALVEAMDRRHRKQNAGEPLSQAALAYIKGSLEQSQTACFPFPASGLNGVFAKQSVDDSTWLAGYEVVRADTGEPLSPSALKALAERPSLSPQEALDIWRQSQARPAAPSSD